MTLLVLPLMKAQDSAWRLTCNNQSIRQCHRHCASQCANQLSNHKRCASVLTKHLIRCRHIRMGIHSDFEVLHQCTDVDDNDDLQAASEHSPARWTTAASSQWRLNISPDDNVTPSTSSESAAWCSTMHVRTAGPSHDSRNGQDACKGAKQGLT